MPIRVKLTIECNLPIENAASQENIMKWLTVFQKDTQHKVMRVTSAALITELLGVMQGDQALYPMFVPTAVTIGALIDDAAEVSLTVVEPGTQGQTSMQE